MPRLTSPAGAVVNVADAKVSWLLKQGFQSAEEPVKAPAKKTAARKASSSKPEK